MKNYVNEIFDIAHKNKVDWDVGADMFLANIRNAGQAGLPHYAGANLDYAALKASANAIQDSKQAFVDAVNENYQQIVALRNDGKFEEVRKLIGA